MNWQNFSNELLKHCISICMNFNSWFRSAFGYSGQVNVSRKELKKMTRNLNGGLKINSQEAVLTNDGVLNKEGIVTYKIPYAEYINPEELSSSELSLFVIFDISHQEDIQHLDFIKIESSDLMVTIDENILRGYIQVLKYYSTDRKYEDMEYFDIDGIRKIFNVISTSKYIKNISVHYSIGTNFLNDLEYIPDRLYLDFIAMLEFKSLSIHLLRHLPNDFSDILDKLASISNNIDELKIFKLKGKIPEEFVCFKNIKLKKIYLGAFQWNKPFPKFLYEFASSLEELVLDFDIIKLPKQIEKFQNLVYLQLDTLQDYSFPESFKNMNNLKAISFTYIEDYSLPILPDNIISNISYLRIQNGNHLNLDELKKYSNLESLILSPISQYTKYDEIIISRKYINMRYKLFKRTKKGCFPEEILELKNLKYLCLAQTNITYIPEEIIQLNNLEYLDLQFTKLKSLPDYIYKLKNLKYINIYGSMIKLDKNSNFLNVEIINKMPIFNEYAYEEWNDPTKIDRNLFS